MGEKSGLDDFSSFMMGSSLGAELFSSSELFSGFDFSKPATTTNSSATTSKPTTTSSAIDLSFDLSPLSLLSSFSNTPSSSSTSEPAKKSISTPEPPPPPKKEKPSARREFDAEPIITTSSSSTESHTKNITREASSFTKNSISEPKSNATSPEPVVSPVVSRNSSIRSSPSASRSSTSERSTFSANRSKSPTTDKSDKPVSTFKPKSPPIVVKSTTAPRRPIDKAPAIVFAKSKSDDPKSRTESKPKVPEEKPKIIEEKPKVVEEQSKPPSEKPLLLQQSFKIPEGKPQPPVEKPKVYNAAPIVPEEKSKIMEIKPKIDQNKPKSKSLDQKLNLSTINFNLESEDEEEVYPLPSKAFTSPKTETPPPLSPPPLSPTIKPYGRKDSAPKPWQASPRGTLTRNNEKKEPIPVKDVARAMDFEKLLQTRETVRLSSTPDRLKNIEVKTSPKVKYEPREPVSNADREFDSDSDNEYAPKHKKQESFMEFIRNSSPEDYNGSPRNKSAKLFEDNRNQKKEFKDFLRNPPSSPPLPEKKKKTVSALKLFGLRKTESGPEISPSSHLPPPVNSQIKPQRTSIGMIDAERERAELEARRGRRSSSQNSRDDMFDHRSVESDSRPSSVGSGKYDHSNGKRSRSEPAVLERKVSDPPPPVPEITRELLEKINKAKEEPKPIQPPSVPTTTPPNQNLTRIPSQPSKSNSTELPVNQESRESKTESVMQKLQSVKTPADPLLAPVNKSQSFLISNEDRLNSPGDLSEDLSSDFEDDTSRYSMLSDRSNTSTVIYSRYNHNSSNSIQASPLAEMVSQAGSSTSLPLEQVADELKELDRDFAKLFEEDGIDDPRNSVQFTHSPRNSGMRPSFLAPRSASFNSPRGYRNPMAAFSSVSLQQVKPLTEEISTQCEITTMVEEGCQINIKSETRSTDMQTGYWWNDSGLKSQVGHVDVQTLPYSHFQSTVDVQTDSAEFSREVSIQCTFIGNEVPTTSDAEAQTIYDVLVVEDIPLDEEDLIDDSDVDGSSDVWRRKRFSHYMRQQRSQNSLNGSYEIAEPLSPILPQPIVQVVEKKCEVCEKRQKYETWRNLEEVVRNSGEETSSEQPQSADYERPESTSPHGSKSETSDVSDSPTLILNSASVDAENAGQKLEENSKHTQSSGTWPTVHTSSQTGSKVYVSTDSQTTEYEHQHSIEIQCDASEFVEPPSVSEIGIQATVTQELCKDVETQADYLKPKVDTMETQTEAHLIATYIREQTESSNVYTMLIQENTRLHEETTSLKLMLATERARREAAESERIALEAKFEQLARLSHLKLNESNVVKKNMEVEIQSLNEVLRRVRSLH